MFQFVIILCPHLNQSSLCNIKNKINNIGMVNIFLFDVCMLRVFCSPGTSAKLRMIVQEGLNKLRAGEKNGLQPALVIYWAQCLSQMVRRCRHLMKTQA